MLQTLGPPGRPGPGMRHSEETEDACTAPAEGWRRRRSSPRASGAESTVSAVPSSGSGLHGRGEEEEGGGGPADTSVGSTRTARPRPLPGGAHVSVCLPEAVPSPSSPSRAPSGAAM